MWHGSALLVLSFFLCRAQAAPGTSGPPPPPPGVPQTDYDVIVVGGGPSGLSALSGLARVRQHAFLIDSGVYRNGATRHAHDILGLDGVTPAYLRWIGRQKIKEYKTVQMSNGTVTKIVPSSDPASFTSFTVYADLPSQANAVLTARKVVLGTGLLDILPDTPGVQQNWGKGIYWCPWCDGIEHADQPMGLLGSLDNVPSMVKEIWNLNTDVIAFVNGTDTPAMRAEADAKMPQWQEYLQLQNVTINNGSITEIERLKDGGATPHDPSKATAPEYDLFRVHFADGPPVDRAVFFTSFPSVQESLVGANMGVQLVYENRMVANQSEGMVTNVPGACAVGDANSDNSTNVPHALYSGKRAAVYLHLELEDENAEAELADAEPSQRKRDVRQEAEAVWKRMNGEPGDVLYAGEFDQ